MTACPAHLAAPPASGPTYGRLVFDAPHERFEIRDAQPAVLEMAKRVFPGCVVRGQSDQLKFKATPRAVGELNWLMLRYPLAVDSPVDFATHRQRAIEHALRRAVNDGPQVPAEPPATFAGTLYEFQAQAVTFLTANQRCLLADDMGLGKTVEALAALSMVDAFPCCIVVPANVQRQWQRQCGRWLRLGRSLLEDPDGVSISHVVRGLRPYELPRLPVTIIHYGLLRGWKETLPSLGFKAVIFDEIQELRHTGTEKYSAASLLAGECRYVWGLSGTPVYNYGDEMWSVMNILDYHCLGDADSFSREWCTGYQSKVVSKTTELGDYLRREGLMIRRRKSEVQSQLPPKRRAVIAVDKDADRHRHRHDRSDSLYRHARQRPTGEAVHRDGDPSHRTPHRRHARILVGLRRSRQ